VILKARNHSLANIKGPNEDQGLRIQVLEACISKNKQEFEVSFLIYGFS
jgi:hypothetical protein